MFYDLGFQFWIMGLACFVFLCCGVSIFYSGFGLFWLCVVGFVCYGFYEACKLLELSVSWCPTQHIWLTLNCVIFSNYYRCGRVTVSMFVFVLYNSFAILGSFQVKKKKEINFGFWVWLILIFYVLGLWWVEFNDLFALLFGDLVDYYHEAHNVGHQTQDIHWHVDTDSNLRKLHNSM
jgi:hypothetical protein